MNKQEKENLALIAVSLRIGELTPDSAARQLEQAFPGISELVQQYLVPSQFDQFFTLLVDYCVDQAHGNSWALKRDTCAPRATMDALRGKAARQAALETYLLYMENTGLDIAPTADELPGVFASTDWQQAKAQIAEDYGYDVSLLP